MIPAGTNHCINPSFETSVTNGWTVVNASRAQSTLDAFAGSNACLLTLTSIASTPSLAISSGSRPALSEDDSVAVAIAVKATSLSAGNQVRLRTAFYTAGVESDVQTEAAVEIADDGWTILSTARIAPAGVDAVGLSVELSSGWSISDTVLIDACMVRINEPHDVYFDGDSGDDYDWTGTAHSSTSTRAENAGVTKPDSDSEGAVVSFTLYRCNKRGEKLDELTELLVDGRVNFDHDREIKQTLDFTLRSAVSLGAYTDHVRLYATINFDDDRETITRSAGVYAITLPDVTGYWEHAEAHYEAADLTIHLARSGFRKTHNIAAGTNYRTAIVAIITAAGFDADRIDITATSRTLSKATSFPIGMSRLEAVNHLLEAIGYYTLAADRDGTLTSEPIKRLRSTHPVRTYYEWDLLKPIEERPIQTTIANVVVVKRESGSAGVIAGIAVNDDPASPTSTVNVGEIMRVVTDAHIEDQADAEALAQQYLDEGDSYYRSLKLMVAPEPRIGVRHTIDLSYHAPSGVCYCGRYWVRQWSFGLQPATAPLDIEVGRLEVLHPGGEH